MVMLRLTGLAAGEDYDMTLTAGGATQQITGTWETAPAVPQPASLETINIPQNMEGRVTRVRPPVPDLADINSVRIVQHPAHGRLTINDDNTLSWVLTFYLGEDPDSFTYEYDLVSAPGTFIPVTETIAAIVDSPLLGNWPTGLGYYFEVDDTLYSVIEPGENHRKFYCATDGLTAQTIALAHGVDVTTVKNVFLSSTPAHPSLGGDGVVLYGETEALALESSLGVGVWGYYNPENGSGRSDWLLFKRGQNHGDQGRLFLKGVRGESPMHPLLIDAWGVGSKPVLTGSIQVGAGLCYNLVFRNLSLEDGARFNVKGEGSIATTRGGNYLVEAVDQVGGTSESVFTEFDRGCLRWNRHIRQIEDIAAGISTSPYWWNESSNRVSSIFMDQYTDGYLEGVLAYHPGWEDGYDVFSRTLDAPTPPSGTGGQAPSAKSQGFYLQKRGWGLILRDCVAAMTAGGGIQARAGAVLIDPLLIDNNQQGFTAKGSHMATLDPDRNSGQWSMWDGFLSTSSGYRQAWEPRKPYTDMELTPLDFSYPGVNDTQWTSTAGTMSFGVKVQGNAWTSLYKGIACHLADPNNPDEIALKVRNGNGINRGDLLEAADSLGFNNSRCWNWDGNDTELNSYNVEELNPATLNQTTMQTYVDGHAGTQAFVAANPQFAGAENRIMAWCEYYAQLETPRDMADEQKALMNHFRAAFGDPLKQERTVPTTLSFSASPIADGVQWLYRCNWSSDDLPIDGDNIDLRGCWTRFSCMTLAVNGLDLGQQGRVSILNGRLRQTGPLASDGGVIEIDYVGRFYSAGYNGAQPLALRQTGGRFVNEGVYNGNADVTVSGGQCVLAEAGGSFTLQAANTMTITGAPKIGFDGTAGGTASARFNGTLAFVAANGKIGSIKEFHSGRHGTAARNVISEVILESGATVTVDTTGLSSGTYTLIDVDSLTNNGATLPAGVSVNGKRLVLTVA